jgi:hypothetical protein
VKRLGAAAVVALTVSAASAVADTGPYAGFPVPPPGATVFSRQLGANALALAVVPRSGTVLVQASVVGRQGTGVRGLAVTFETTAASRRAVACGPGCYRAALPFARAIRVRLRGGGRATTWRVTLPRTPRDGSALLARAGRVWRSLHSLTFRERLASDARHVSRSMWRVEAPNRVAYEVQGGWAGVIVGARRWDRKPGGGDWVASAQTPLTQPEPPWTSVRDAHVIGVGTMNGRPTCRITFWDPGSHAWFDVRLDRTTLRTLATDMVATAHFMHDVYSAFDVTPSIEPPS